jgi:endonuclease YncB( thermonuclease family)
VGPDRLRRVWLVALALVAGCGGDATPRPQADGESARIDSVRDGDTILLTNGFRVRLVQVDAPELAVECYGDEAARALERLAPPGSAITLEEDPVLDRIDRHGRLLRYGHVAGRNLNVELVRMGAAAPYFYRGERGAYADALERAARRARAEGPWALERLPGGPPRPAARRRNGAGGRGSPPMNAEPKDVDSHSRRAAVAATRCAPTSSRRDWRNAGD